MTDARRGWLKNEMDEVRIEVAAWPAWKRGEMMTDARPRNCPTCESPASHLHPAMQSEGEVQPCKDPWHHPQPQPDAQREPVTRYEPCPLCTASRPRLCDLHYRQKAEEFLETVKQAIVSPRTPGGVKAAYEELLAQNRALADAQATISRLEDRIDLQCDEFQRISALTENDEVKGLCARAVKDIRQHVPVIQQRDTAEQQVARLREAHEEAYQVISLWFKYFNSDIRPIEQWTEVSVRVNAWLPTARALRETGA